MDSLRPRILEHCLLHIPFEGWSEKALEAGTKDAGLDPQYHRIAFPGGVPDAIEMFVAQNDARICANLATQAAGLKIRQRITLAVHDHIEGQSKPVMRALASYFANPLHASFAARCTWSTASQIWYTLGDNASDMNHYSKRLILSGVYLSTLLYWLQDDSENNTKTWEFLDRRIQNALNIGKVKQGFNSIKERLERLSYSL